ncbi:hypothetical protein [Xanthobacter autotrophicus]|uniref:hypothetical protein n=1 Tax=Xanthobacter autotrophicus TaxID=280 RepID=UPI003729DB38
MTSTLMVAGLIRAYGDLATQAWRKRLTNADIAAIERETLTLMREAHASAGEFPGFEAEPAIAAAIAELRRLFDAFRAERTKD